MIDEEQLYVCHECVGDEFLKKEIRAEGKRETCSYCEKKRKAVQLKWLAEKIHSAIEEHFYLTPDEPDFFEDLLIRDRESTYNWVRHGEYVNYIIQEIAKVDEPVANDVQDYLSGCFYVDPKELEENPYGEEAHYEEKPPDSDTFQASWDLFCWEITYRARFLSRFTEEILGELFSNLDSLRTYDGKSVIRVAGPNTANPFVFRARVSQSTDTLERILKNPVQELGAPLPKLSKNGRMNAAGISVFYGGSDAETCIVEVRPPIGSHVVIGRFQIIRDIRLLDLNMLSKIFVKGSYFDPEFGGRIEHAAFLEQLVGELTKPVLPDEETLGYLPTQVVAEYLANKAKPRLDGIIFDSSQTQKQGQNVILFYDSCRVKPYNLPTGTTISIEHGWGPPEDYSDSITVFEKLPKNPQIERQEYTNDHELYNVWSNNRDFTLRLDVNEDIDVKKVEGVKYKTTKRYMSRVRREESV